nr:DUF362 domain-containing protein [Candidatus Njordarchaeota archaeon]
MVQTSIPPLDHTVAIGRDANLYRSTFKAVEELGGMEKFVGKGDTVFIKPNLMLFTGPPTTTNPLVVGALIKMCKKAGARRIYVGDQPVVTVLSSFGLEYTGMSDYVSRLSDSKCKVSPIYLKEALRGDELQKELDSLHVKVKIPNGKGIHEMWLPKIVQDSNVFIDVPVAKTHVATDVTFGIKNLHGLFCDAEKRVLHDTEAHLSQKFLDCLRVAYPDLTVVDAWDVGDGQGPFFMDFKHMGAVVAGRDIVAVDAAMSYLMGFNPLKVKMVRMGHEQGFGTANLKEIKFVGEQPDRLRRSDIVRPNHDLTAGNPPNTKILVGTGPEEGSYPCRGCTMALQYIQSGTAWFFPQMCYAVLIGRNPPDPSDLKTSGGQPMPVILWGKCAVETTRNYRFRKRGTREPGGYVEIADCPPIKLVVSEDFHSVALDRKTAVASRWTQRVFQRWVVDLLEFIQGNPSFILSLVSLVLFGRAKRL